MSSKNVFIVLSGKGGVGKSTISSCLALSLARMGYSVGLLDIDLCGPSISRIFGIDNERVMQGANGWIPVGTGIDNLSIMSMAFFLQSQNDSVVWRGPKKNAMIQQFLDRVDWGYLDYLVIDTPPGTSDEHLSIVEYLFKQNCPFENPKAIIVTTPQWISLSDVMKEISFCRTVNLEMIGLIENMSGIKCPHCSECSFVFAQGGGKCLAIEQGIPFLATLPLDAELMQLIEQGGLSKNINEIDNHLIFKAFINEIIPIIK